MHEILFKLTPPELYVWAFLCAWASEGDNDLVAIPRKPPGPPGWQLYTRQHLKRILNGLERKKFLVISGSPANQYQDLIVILASRNRVNIGVHPARRECSGTPLQETFSPQGRTKMFGLLNPGKADRAQEGASGRTSEPGRSPQLSLSSKEEKSLEALAGMGQGDLMRRIRAMGPETVEEIQVQIMKICPWPRSQKVSRKAKLYAAIRFLQDGHQQVKKSPEAWVGAVARRADQELKAWRDDRLESDGRSPYQGKYAVG